MIGLLGLAELALRPTPASSVQPSLWPRWTAHPPELALNLTLPSQFITFCTFTQLQDHIHSQSGSHASCDLNQFRFRRLALNSDAIKPLADVIATMAAEGIRITSAPTADGM
jgi:hypothetical protein